MADASLIPLLEVEDLHVSASASENGPPVPALHGVSLAIHEGEIHVVVGPGGSQTSVLAEALLGSPRLPVTGGTVRFQGDDVTHWSTDVRAKAGLFLAFQYPQEIAGVSVLSFLRQALSARKGVEMSVLELRLSLLEWMEKLHIDPTFIDRHLNEGQISGGTAPAEMARNEILQMAVLEPEMAVLHHGATGGDDESLRTIAAGVHTVRRHRPTLGTLAITDDSRLVSHLQPDQVHVLIEGRIAASGGPELAKRLETDGYESFI